LKNEALEEAAVSFESFGEFFLATQIRKLKSHTQEPK
jgi:hypothetical protein